MMGLVPLIFKKKRHERAYFSFILSLSCKDTKRRLLPVNHKEGSHQTPTYGHPGLGLPTSRTVKTINAYSLSHTVHDTLLQQPH